MAGYQTKQKGLRKMFQTTRAYFFTCHHEFCPFPTILTRHNTRSNAEIFIRLFVVATAAATSQSLRGKTRRNVFRNVDNTTT